MENCRMPWTFSTFYCHQTPCLSTWGSKFQLSYNEVKVRAKCYSCCSDKTPRCQSVAKFALFFFKKAMLRGKKRLALFIFPLLNYLHHILHRILGNVILNVMIAY